MVVECPQVKLIKIRYNHPMNKEKLLPVLVIIIIIIYASFNYLSKTKSSKVLSKSKTSTTKFTPKELNETTIVNYIIDVINNGSNRFNFPGGEMEGGYIPKDKAKDVACYVYELSGRKCSHKYAKDAQLYFSSNCAGCHGNDAKGLHGTYPNLTKKRLLGLGGVK